jgi:hypothetical protein
MHLRIILAALLIAAAAYFVVLVPSLERTEETVVPRTAKE